MALKEPAEPSTYDLASLSLCLKRKGSLNSRPGDKTVVPGPEVGELVFWNNSLGFIAKDEAEHIVPGNEGDVGVGAEFVGQIKIKITSSKEA